MKRARRAALAIIAALGAACSNGPAGPTGITVTVAAPPLTGTWKGLFEIISCTGSSGRCSGALIRDFTLVLVPAGTGVEGFMLLDDNAATLIDVRSAATPEGGLTLTAFAELQPGVFQHRTNVGSFELHEDPSSGLAGSIDYSTTVEDDGRVIDTTHRSLRIRSAVRLPAETVSPGRFDGTWRGYYRTLACSGDCHTGIWFMDRTTGDTVTLKLAQQGGAVTGTLNGLVVQGAASGAAVSLDGAPLSPEPCGTCWDCDGICQYSSRNLEAHVDKLGRLTGTFEVSKKAVFSGRHVRQTLTVELVGVIRQR